ncbi:MAG: DUF2141 domain-containing protein [Pseudomonadota bacterium]|uniref:DUF2141 domain-containing protein n=1 Tax=unclassified Phenylobacterium TaxID=2640670 RepID=UPI0006FACE39|nr:MULTISPECIES: DUF2141 domain-containing protein [unclassified Phenylobacterium]KRB49422.1 hypothetical protein ASE02_16495 [Phenylobacterium sp. Root700]MBT9473644.1 DUF2141 domain-containing protein [Phenylobacterium sp.]
MKVRTGLAAAAFVAISSLAGPSLAADECAGKPSDNRLTVSVTGVRPAQGEVAITLYPDDAKRFLAPKGKLLRQRVPAKSPTTSTCFYLPAAGVYAIAVYHDVNADHDFNRSLVGMPTEGYGFSNDAPTKISLPAFSTVRFRVPAGTSRTTLRMRYP